MSSPGECACWPAEVLASAVRFHGRSARQRQRDQLIARVEPTVRATPAAHQSTEREEIIETKGAQQTSKRAAARSASSDGRGGLELSEGDLERGAREDPAFEGLEAEQASHPVEDPVERTPGAIGTSICITSLGAVVGGSVDHLEEGRDVVLGRTLDELSAAVGHEAGRVDREGARVDETAEDHERVRGSSLTHAAIMLDNRAGLVTPRIRAIEDLALESAVGVVRHDEGAETTTAGRDRRHTCSEQARSSVC